MTAYASKTGTRRNLAVLRAAGWRLMLSPHGKLTPGNFPYALDNGAWTAHQQGRPIDLARFSAAVELVGARADWVVLPDIVAGGLASLELSAAWLPRLRGVAPLMLPVQDGMGAADVRGLLGPHVGIFLGGSTAWKLQSLPAWGELAHELGCALHVARVNTARRIRLAHRHGATSFDGSSVSRFACTLPLLDAARQQPSLLAPARREYLGTTNL